MRGKINQYWVIQYNCRKRIEAQRHKTHTTSLEAIPVSTQNPTPLPNPTRTSFGLLSKSFAQAQNTSHAITLSANKNPHFYLQTTITFVCNYAFYTIMLPYISNPLGRSPPYNDNDLSGLRGFYCLSFNLRTRPDAHISIHVSSITANIHPLQVKL